MLDNWSVMATELVPSTILFPAKKWFLWNENLNTFHRYLLKALLCILFKVSFHVAVWPVRLCCIILYVPLHVFEYLRICPLIAACKLSRQHFPKFKNEILFTFLCLSVGRREGGYREFLKCGGGGGLYLGHSPKNLQFDPLPLQLRIKKY